MLEIAEKYLERLSNGIEIKIISDATIKKPYGNIYHFNSKIFFETRDFMDGLAGNTPFLVEKKQGRVVQFHSDSGLEHQILTYENQTFKTSDDTFWYPDEDRFSHE